MKEKILIIDDEKDFTLFLKVFLESMGYSVIEANNAIDSGMYLNTGNPDLIIMDLKMPGINGFDACQAIRKNPKTRKVPIFIVSGLTSEDDIKKGLKAGANKYFTKPLDHDNLIKELEKLFG